MIALPDARSAIARGVLVGGLVAAALLLACTRSGGPTPGPAEDTATPAGAAAALPAAAPAPTPVTMKFGLNAPTAYVAPAWIAKEEGFFARYGIDAELVVMQSSAQLAPALVAGEIPLTLAAASGILASALAGSDLVLLGGYENKLRFWLFARPDVPSVAALRDRPVAITRRGGAVHQAAELALRRSGLDPDRDVQLIQAGSTRDALTALLTGGVAAAILSPPSTFTAEDEGMRLLVDTGEYNYPLILQGIAASRAWVAQNGDLARRGIQAIAEGVAFAHRAKARTKQIIGQYLRVEDERLLERTYDTLVPGWERVLYAPPEALQPELESLADEIPAARTARPEQFVDNRFVEELERAGFFRQLYSGGDVR